MLGVAFDRGGGGEDVVAGVAGQEGDVAQGGRAAGERAGLVEDDRIDGGEALDRLGGAEEHAQLGGAPAARHDGGGGGEAERAGAGDDEHRDGVERREGEGGRRPHGQPEQEGGGGDDQHGGHEDAGDAVGEGLHGGLGGLGRLDEGDDAGEHGVGADLCGAHAEGAGAVDRRAEDLRAGGLVDGHALAREHRLIDRAGAGQDDAVDGDLVAGADEHDVAGADLIDGHVHRLGVLAVAQQMGGLGPEVEQAADGGRGAPLGARLQVAAERDEADDDEGGLVEDGAVEAGAVEGAGRERRGDAVGHGGRRADGDEHVHVGAAVPHDVRRGAEDATPAPAVDGRRDAEENQEEDVRVPVEAGGAVDLHGEEDGPAEREGEQGVGQEAAAFVVAAPLAGFGCGRRLGLGARRDDAVARGGDCARQGVGQGVGGDIGAGQVDAGALGGEVDGRGLDAGDAGQRPLDAADTGGAVHPLDVQIEAGGVVAPGRWRHGRRERGGGHGEERRVGHGDPPMPAYPVATGGGGRAARPASARDTMAAPCHAYCS